MCSRLFIWRNLSANRNAKHRTYSTARIKDLNTEVSAYKKPEIEDN